MFEVCASIFFDQLSYVRYGEIIDKFMRVVVYFVIAKHYQFSIWIYAHNIADPNIFS